MSASQFDGNNVAQFPPRDGVLKHSGGDGGNIGPMEARVTALETKWDTVVPTLATKTDIADAKSEIADLKAEMHKGFSDQVKWIVGTGFVGMAAFITIMTFVLNNAVPKMTAAPASASAPIIIQMPAQAAPVPAPAASR